MNVMKQITSNQVLVCACFGWLVAQFLKTLIDMWYNKSFSPERLYGSGGMPSSHSATVCALTTSAAYCYGLQSFQFAVCFVLSVIVMYDAMGVRRETGKQAKLLNMIMEQDFWKFDNPDAFQEKLKELVGHTPLQVLMGAILGIVVALVTERVVYLR
jgi:acid phosphatase family membrane protein YuiD